MSDLDKRLMKLLEWKATGGYDNNTKIPSIYKTRLEIKVMEVKEIVREELAKVLDA
jgi:hypothetical protein